MPKQPDPTAKAHSSRGGRSSYIGTRDPVRCLVCRHPKVIEIDIALAKGQSVNSLAKQYGINREPLYKHKKKGHIMATAKGEVWDMSRPRDQHMATSRKLFELLGQVQAKLEASKDLDIGTVRVFVGLIREQRATLEAAEKARGDTAPRQTTAQIIAEVMGVIAEATMDAGEVREAIASMFVARGMIDPPVTVKP